ncbi:MAG: hypothetical protein HKN60_06065 [Rhizobiales bacterium]|nr:hypothetical protein [Hyphomicrobiales bacterium]
MGGVHFVWKLWFFMCAVWLAMLAATLGLMSGSTGWLRFLNAAFVYGIAPILAGTVLIYWSYAYTNWRPGRQKKRA